jgi:hypothetical protein
MDIFESLLHPDPPNHSITAAPTATPTDTIPLLGIRRPRLLAFAAPEARDIMD